MLFNSISFALFFPVVTLLYFWLPRRARASWLLCASCLFYMAFIPRYLLILIFTIGVDYLAGLVMEKSQGARRKICLIASILANVAVLAVFKYADFFLLNTNALFQVFGSAHSFPLLNWVLPIGLSFHTFQAMSYTIEVYRGNQKAERNLIVYALYVMFYPQLVAGPIERPQNLLPQFHVLPTPDANDLSVGARLMLWGFFKKLFIADRLAMAVNPMYASPGAAHGLAAWLGVYFFAFQIYCDFSAYSDIARGAARIMGFRLMQNFNLPYFSESPSEFWRRWHISLSTWFKDYLYVPLGGNRVPTSRRAFNLMVVFLVSGLWHGASWTFVAWGALHGLALIATQAWRGPLLPAFWRRLLTFHFVAFAWIFFRAPTFAVALQIVRGLGQWSGSFSLNALSVLGLGHFDLLMCAVAIGILLTIESAERFRDFSIRFAAWPTWARWLSYYSTTGAIALLGKFTAQPFIYFQF